MDERARAALQIAQNAARARESVFDQRGQLRNDASAQGDVRYGEYLHIGTIAWQPDPDSSEHAIKLARLVEYMCTITEPFGGFGPFSAHDSKVLHAVAMLYGVGRVKPSDTPGEDKGYEQRSATYAESFFRNGGGSGTYWSSDVVREETCRLIFKHNIPEEIRIDKRLQIFADAVRYEVSRYSPNTAVGLSLLKERIKPELFHTGWAKDRANLRTYMVSRGWR